ncbi:forkhead-associated domain-containing protein 1 isoform X2 [Lampetra fluviatilis]
METRGAVSIAAAAAARGARGEMKAYLKGANGMLPLSQKPIRVGSGTDCQLHIQGCGDTEDRHALLRFSTADGCFVLQDLNSANGTYVNGCRVQNATVRLAPGDTIRFGGSPHSYSLEVPAEPQVCCPPVGHKQAWSGPITVLQETPSSPVTHPPLPVLGSPAANSADTRSNPWSQWNRGSGIPHPPQKPRPHSAGSRRLSSSIHSPTATAPEDNWSHCDGYSRVNGDPVAIQCSSEALFQQKEQQLLKLGDEVKRLLVFEAESKRKDLVISTLRDETGALRQQLTQQELWAAERDGTRPALERELHNRTQEVRVLREQLNRLEVGSSEVLNHTARERDVDVAHLKTELDKACRDLALAKGLVTSLQREASQREEQLRRLHADLLSTQRELREGEQQQQPLASTSGKSLIQKETQRLEEALAAREEEVESHKHAIRKVELRLRDMEVEVENLKREKEDVAKCLSQEKQALERVQEEGERLGLQAQEASRRERLATTRHQEAQHTLAELRAVLVRLLPSASDAELPPEPAINQVEQQLSRIVARVAELEAARGGAAEEEEMWRAHCASLQQALVSVQAAAEGGAGADNSDGPLGTSVWELQALCVEGPAASLRDALCTLVGGLVAWQGHVLSALTDAGVRAEDSRTPDGIAACIRTLHQQCQETTTHCNTIQLELAALQEKHEEEARTREEEKEQSERERQELERVHEQEREGRLQREIEQRLQHDVEGIRDQARLEIQQREEAATACQNRTQEAEAELTQLRTAMEDKERAVADLQAALDQAARDAEQLKADAERSREEEVQMAREDERRSRDTEVAGFREQASQHALTIVSLEGRLSALLAQSAHDSRSAHGARRAPASGGRRPSGQGESPKSGRPGVGFTETDGEPTEMVPAAASCGGRSCSQLRRDLTEVRALAQSHHDEVQCLKRKLATALGRLSDIAGELSEGQKVAVEHGRAQLREARVEHERLQCHVTQLSRLTHKQTRQLQQANEQLRQYGDRFTEQQRALNDKRAELENLQAEMSQMKASTSTRLALQRQQAGEESDAAERAARCKGHRHDEVIQRQKEALVELRARLKAMEKLRPELTVSTSKSVLQQEFAQEVKRQEEFLALLPAGEADAESHLSAVMAEAAMERMARLETMESLELSERSYLDLAQALAELLQTPELPGSRPLAVTPREGRAALSERRHEDRASLLSSVRALRSQLQHKETLLQGYEGNLRKLREYEQTAAARAEKVSDLGEEVDRRNEEISLLRQALEQTRAQLESEQRLGRNLKQRRGVVLTLQEKQPAARCTHSCVREDIHGKAESKQRALVERLRKREYEVSVLKGQIRHGASAASTQHADVET